MRSVSKMYDPTGDVGVNRVRGFFLEQLGWIFREQPIADIGIDAVVEVVEDGVSTGDLIALQIKTGYKAMKRQDGSLRFSGGDPRSAIYWSSFSLPVLLVVVDIENSDIHWLRLISGDIEFYTTEKGKSRWAVEVPAENRLDSTVRGCLIEISRESKALTAQIEELQANLKRLERLAFEYTCELCGALMDSRSVENRVSMGDEYNDREYEVEVEEYACGARVENGEYEFLCDGFPSLLDNYEIIIEHRGERVLAHASPVTFAVKSIPLHIYGCGQEEVEATVALFRRFYRMVDPRENCY